MKVLTLFMAIFMLITAFDLCRDDDCDINERSTKVNEAGNNTTDQEALCAPFCNCTRCPFSVIIYATITGIPDNSYLSEKSGSGSLEIPVETGNPVWQPPKFL